jgi:hypothetical protein
MADIELQQVAKGVGGRGKVQHSVERRFAGTSRDVRVREEEEEREGKGVIVEALRAGSSASRGKATASRRSLASDDDLGTS